MNEALKKGVLLTGPLRSPGASFISTRKVYLTSMYWLQWRPTGRQLLSSWLLVVMEFVTFQILSCLGIYELSKSSLFLNSHPSSPLMSAVAPYCGAEVDGVEDLGEGFPEQRCPCTIFRLLFLIIEGLTLTRTRP